MTQELATALDGARWVQYDEDRGCVLVWRGGHGIRVFNSAGAEVHVFSVGDFAEEDAALEDVRAGMDGWCRDGEDEWEPEGGDV